MWLFVLALNSASVGEHQRLVVQSAAIFRRRPIRNFVPAAPPASTVGALRVLCSAGLPMSLLA